MTISVLTIGAGFFAELHVEAWSRHPKCTFLGLVDRDQAKANALISRHAPEATSFADAAQAIAALKPDIIDIATPPASHPELVALADGAHPRAIICQKPFCGTLNAAKQVTAQTNAPLFVHENIRFQPWYRLLKAQLDSGTIGSVYQATFRLRPGDGQGAEAYLARQPYFQSMERFLIHETGIHWIDTFRYLLGEPSSIYADLRQLNPAIAGEDAGVLILEFDQGMRAIFDGNRLADHAADNPRLTMGECIIEGSDGTLVLDGFGHVHVRKAGQIQLSKIDQVFDPTSFGGDCVYAFQDHVLSHLMADAPIETRALDYLRNMEIEEAAYLSASQGKRRPL